jgi:heterodisulfide reductase subunit C2
MEQTDFPIIEMDSAFLNEVEQGSGIKVSACFQCRKCTNGCPATFAMDIFPDQIMRYIHLGRKNEVMHSATLWVCASCETCTTRCPNAIDIAGVMDYLKQTVVREKAKPREKKILAFHRVFLEDIRKRGRIFEAGMMQNYLLKSGDLVRKLKDRTILEDLRLGWTMASKGRLTILPKKIKASAEIKNLFNRR